MVSSCPWEKVSWLSSIQARPKDGKVLRGMRAHEVDKALAALACEIHDLGGANARAAVVPGSLLSPERMPFIRLPKGAEHFLGRGAELQALDTAWGDGTAIV